MGIEGNPISYGRLPKEMTDNNIKLAKIAVSSMPSLVLGRCSAWLSEKNEEHLELVTLALQKDPATLKYVSSEILRGQAECFLATSENVDHVLSKRRRVGDDPSSVQQS